MLPLLFILVPLAGFLASLLPANHQEKFIFRIALGTVLLHAGLLVAIMAEWISGGAPYWHEEGPLLYESGDSHFSIGFFFDRTAAVYGTVMVLLTVLILFFSRSYIHREKGYKRFFSNILFFYTGLSFILFAGNFETVFIGWEIIGASSFFLIAFYRDRYLPVKNAMKVFSLYRVADVFLLLGIWICHHYFQRSITFGEMQDMLARGEVLVKDDTFQWAIPMLFLMVAVVKSAQFPFSSWLPRAMEGPTTSSAIFYGSLSVHIGVFLLIRTWPLWEHSIGIKGLVIGIGVLTTIVATLIAQVQSSIKTQIAYSSIAQIGLMFVEVALGFHTFALIHFAGNAFLRSYQLLVSPSVLSYMIHDQFFSFVPPQHKFTPDFAGKIRSTLYILSIKEWNLDTTMYRFLWQPLKKLGKSLNFITAKIAVLVFMPLYAVGLYFVYHRASIPVGVEKYLPVVLALTGALMMLKAFVKRNDALNSWLLIVVSQLFIALAIAFNEQFDFGQVHLYLSGIAVSAAIGYFCFQRLKNSGEATDLNRFHGHAYEHPRLASLFLIACLGLTGFPVTPTFIGEDVILGHIHENQFLLTFLIALTLILDGLAVFRIYCRLFMGPHSKAYHEVAYRSS
jgi:NADH-quinone oxidoreductase subunit L